MLYITFIVQTLGDASPTDISCLADPEHAELFIDAL